MSKECNFVFLEKMLNTCSPSGFEGEISSLYKNYLDGFCDKTYCDALGNTIGVINEHADFKIMLAGHYDEIGYQIVHISDDGLIYFRRVGGIDKRTILGTQVVILGRNKKILGIIGSTPIHLVKSKDKDNIVDMSKMWIDVGAKSKKELEGVISVGDPVTVDPNYSHLRNNRLTSKGLDDKVGAFIVAEVTRLISKSIKSNIGIYCVGTVQEELGLRGSKTSSFGIDPDIGIAVDVGFASDTPDIDVCEIGVVKLGEGPIIYRNADQDAPFINKIIDISKNNKIKFQLNADIHSVSGTDVASIRLTKRGIRTFSIGVPLRYMHTQVELVDLNDVESSVELISKFINHLDCN